MSDIDIKKLRKEQKLTQKEFSSILGIAQSYLSELETGRRDISKEVWGKLVDCFGEDVILQYKKNNITIIPEAVMIRPVSNDVYLETKAGVKYYEMENGKFRMRVPLVPFCAYGRFIDETTSNIVQDRETWDEVEFVVDQIGHGSYISFEVKGDSMDDDSRRSFVQGDIVLARELDKVHWKSGLRYEKYPFWVIVLDSTILIKQIVDQNLETGDITCHSLNPSPEYQDFTVNLDNVYRIFNVIQRLSTL